MKKELIKKTPKTENYSVGKNMTLIIIAILIISSLYQFFYLFSINTLHDSLFSATRIATEIHSAENFHGSIHNMLVLSTNHNNENIETIIGEYYSQKDIAEETLKGLSSGFETISKENSEISLEELETIFADFVAVTTEIIHQEGQFLATEQEARRLFDIIFNKYIKVLHTNHKRHLRLIETTAHKLSSRANVLFIIQLVVTALSGILLLYFSFHKVFRPFKKAEMHALTDGLTGLYNRRYLDTVAIPEMKKLIKSNTPFIVSLIDIDFFKKLNDTYGHKFGDAVLTNLATLVSSKIRNSDTLIRYGGEEFLILIPAVTRQKAKSILETLRLEIEKTDFSSDAQTKKVRVTASFGAAIFGDSSETFEKLNPDQLIMKADENLYIAKKSGRNQVTI